MKSTVVTDFSQKTIRDVLGNNILEESTLHTDEAHHYKKPGKRFFGHESVNHSSEEYVRYQDGEKITTNTVEGFFGIFKRGMTGVYQHCGENHLQAYMHEFDFRYSNRAKLGVDDNERTRRAIKGAAGKRLTYQGPCVSRAAYEEASPRQERFWRFWTSSLDGLLPPRTLRAADDILERGRPCG